MKEYILKFQFTDGKIKSIRKLLSSKEETFAIKSVGIYDKNDILFLSAEPVEINVRSEIKKQFLSKK